MGREIAQANPRALPQRLTRVASGVGQSHQLVDAVAAYVSGKKRAVQPKGKLQHDRVKPVQLLRSNPKSPSELPTLYAFS